MDIVSLQQRLSDYGQSHLLQFWPILSDAEKESLYAELMAIDYKAVGEFFKTCTAEMNSGVKVDEFLEPVPVEAIGSAIDSDTAKLSSYEEEGLRQISEGTVAVLLLAGGQGTRLGVTYPKGMYDVGLPSRRTLYQFQAERIIKIQRIASKLTGKAGIVTWYIMTSEHTQEPTLEFFKKHCYFGLDPENVVFFEQNTLPCMTFDGRIILETPSKVSRAPDGNGGLYKAIEDNKILEDMTSRGVQYIHVYCVDNILVKMADPAFIGFCISCGASCGAKVVEKCDPTEPVGVIGRLHGRYHVVEYSEISRETSEKKDPITGKLVFNAGGIANHLFTRDFLAQIVTKREGELKHHVAKKKISFCDETGVLVKPTTANGIKMEKFVFDVFQFSDSFVVWEVSRDDEFSPLKNADGAATDTPTTSREALLNLHGRWVLAAGGTFTVDHDSSLSMDAAKTQIAKCEISPLLSYAGEGLESVVKGRSFAPLTVLEG